jgi:hypothetical protein
MIRSSIRSLCPGFPADHPMATLRPEQLSVDQFIDLTRAVSQLKIDN